MRPGLLVSVLSMMALTCACSPSAERRAEALLEGMTVRQKVAQLVIVHNNGSEKPERAALLDTLIAQGLGGLIWMDGPVAPLVEQTERLQLASAVPLLVTVDAEWGLSMRCPEYLKFPKQGELALLEDAPKQAYAMGRAIAAELRDVGIHANFAPVVDINTNPEVQVLGLRAFGSDPEEVATLALAYERGMREGGILTSAKHFPGHGEASVDSHRSLPVLELDRARLDSVELRPFRELIAAGVPMVMIGHLSVPALDPTGTPASISRPIITGVLKGEMGFDGIVITDALEMRGLLNGRDSCEVVLEAFRAGADILLMPKDAQGAIDLITEAVERGDVPLPLLDEKVRKMLRLKAALGLLERKYDPRVKDLDTKVAAARQRDSVLIASFRPRIEESH